VKGEKKEVVVHNTAHHMAATITQSSQHHHQYYNGMSQSPHSDASPAYMDSFNDGWRNALKVHGHAHGHGGTTAAISSPFSSTTATGYTNTTNTSNMGLMRTDVFPFMSSDADCSPRSSSSLSSAISSTTGLVSSTQPMVSPSSYLGYGTTQISTTTTGTSQVGLDISDADTSSDGHLDFSSAFAPSPAVLPSSSEWSITNNANANNGSNGNTTTGVELPSQSLLSMHREDSLIGKSIGFEALSSEIDAAPAPSTSTSVKTPSSFELFGNAPYAFDVAPQPVTSTSSSTSVNEFGSLNFDLTFPGLGDIIGAIPTTTPSTTIISSSTSVADSDMEPDASSVTDVDADVASDAWSVSSGPSSPVMPTSPITRMVRNSPLLTSMPAVSSTSLVNPNAALALRPGPYTRGRAAALAAPAAPRELKPVPVARGPHAGLLGGGEMASVGIYTKDDRWRKIERLREKRRARIVVKSSGGQYACRKSFADRRPRIGGRFVKMDDETKRYLSLTKPGASTPANIPTPAALRAYAAQQQQSAATAASAVPTANNNQYNSQLAVAAQAASIASPMMPLFGSNTTSLPPAPSWPAAAVNTTSGHWYGYPNVSSPSASMVSA